MKRLAILIVLAILLASCASITAVSPGGDASATYRGTVLLGDESVSCSTLSGVNSCTVTGRDVQGIAQAVLPLVARYFGIPGAPVPPLPTPTPTPAPTPLPPVPQLPPLVPAPAAKT